MVPDGYTVKEDLWGTTYDNHKVYVCWTGSFDDCLGYVDNKWIKLEKSGALNGQTGQSSNYLYYIDGEGQMVYYYFWSEG